MRPPTRLQHFANSWPKKCDNPLIPPVLTRFIFDRLFSLSQVENEVKRTPLYRCCWDSISRNWWIKEGANRGIFGSFSETVRPCNSMCICVYVYMCICVYVYMCICVYVYMCICVYVYMCICVYAKGGYFE